MIAFKFKWTEWLAIGFVALIITIMVANSLQLNAIKNTNQVRVSSNTIVENSVSPTSKEDIETGDIEIEPPFEIMPKGVPDKYGKEIGVSFDDISAQDQEKAEATLNKLGSLDNQIHLNVEGNRRYIAIVSQISCEYCCGVEAIILENGKAACGCAHSAAMRGLAKYLITNHGEEYSDNEILEELSKWKMLFFPSQMMQKAKVLDAKGIQLNPINLASNKYRGVENAE